MRRKKILIGLAVLALGLLALRTCALQFWEGTLWGPYSGAPVGEPVSTQPVSKLALPGGGWLEVHEKPGAENPILLMRRSDGSVRWARWFRPERKDKEGRASHAWVRDLRLHTHERRGGGHVVRLTCDWEWGGIEGGLLHLDADYEFVSFSLSW